MTKICVRVCVCVCVCVCVSFEYVYRDNIYILSLMCTDVCTCVCGVVLRFALRSLGCKLSLVWIKRNASSHTTYPVL